MSNNNDLESILARSWSSDSLKKRQTALTKTINSMTEQANYFKGTVSDSERKSIDSAISTFVRLRDATAHAKEIISRKEKRYDIEKRRAEKSLEKILEKLKRSNSRTRYLMAFCHELDALPPNVTYIENLTADDQPLEKLLLKIENLSNYFIGDFCRENSLYFVSRDEAIYKKTDLTAENVQKILDKSFSELPAEAIAIAENMYMQIEKMRLIESSDKVTRINKQTKPYNN